MQPPSHNVLQLFLFSCVNFSEISRELSYDLGFEHCLLGEE